MLLHGLGINLDECETTGLEVIRWARGRSLFLEINLLLRSTGRGGSIKISWDPAVENFLR